MPSQICICILLSQLYTLNFLLHRFWCLAPFIIIFSLCFSMNYLCVYSPCGLHKDTTIFSALPCVSSFQRNYCGNCTFLFRVSLLIYAKLFALINTSQSFFIFCPHKGVLFSPGFLLITSKKVSIVHTYLLVKCFYYSSAQHQPFLHTGCWHKRYF